MPPHFPNAAQIPFSTFNNKYYTRSCTIVGRGPTPFNYPDLAHNPDPIFFINDAVCLEKHAHSETFFFAHDPHMLPWLDGTIQSTAVLPSDGKLFRANPNIILTDTAPVVFYRWQRTINRDLLTKTRDELAALETLFTYTGTIHSVIHFIWFCGFTKVNLIGCDGRTNYDPRLENKSNSSPGILYANIRRAQDLLMKALGLHANYL